MNNKFNKADGVNTLSAFEIRKFLNKEFHDIKINVYFAIDSTNNEAKRHSHEGLKYALYISETQTAGRGRLGRSFYSPENTGIYMSLVYKVDMTAIENPMLITLKAAMAVCEAIEELTGLRLGVKWVNDIYLENRKICGILAEGIPNIETGIPDYVVVGIGINVNTTEFPEDIKNKAASIGVSCDRNRMVAEIINKLLPLYKNMCDTSFMDEYRKKSIVIGKKVEFEHDNQVMHGIATGIADSGALIVKTKEDMEYSISSGIVEMCFD